MKSSMPSCRALFVKPRPVIDAGQGEGYLKALDNAYQSQADC